MFGLVKVNAEKEKAEQHKCEFLSNWCLKCLLAKQLLDLKPVSGRILPPNATIWAMVKKYAELKNNQKNSISLKLVYI